MMAHIRYLKITSSLVGEHSFTNMILWCLQIITTSDTISTHCVLSSALHLKHWQWQESMIRIYWVLHLTNHHAATMYLFNVLKSSVLLYLFIQFTMYFTRLNLTQFWLTALRPSIIPRRISKVIFVLGLYEFRAMLEGKIGVSLFFKGSIR